MPPSFPASTTRMCHTARVGHGWWPLVACCLATFLLLAYTTVVTVSATPIVTGLGAGYAAAQWIIDVYTLGLAALVLAFGSLGDRIGHRQLFMIGLTVFGLSSAACALAPSAAMLIAARGVQSVGGAALFATAVPLLTHHYGGPRRARAFAIWGAVAGVGSTVGTIAGGAVIQVVSWRWLFLAAIPLCVIAAVLATVAMSKDAPVRTPLDAVGTLLITTAMAALTFAVIDAGEHGWTSTPTVTGMGVSLAAVTLYQFSARRSARPVLPPDLGNRSFIGVVIVGFGYYFAAFATLPTLSGWLQSTHHLPAVYAAMILSVQLVVFVSVSLLFSARLHDAPRVWVLGGGTLLTGLGCLSGAALLVRPEWTTALAFLIVTGASAAIVSPVLPAVAVASAPAARAGIAAAAANASRQLGLTLGIALCSTINQTITAAGHTAPSGISAAFIAAGTVGVISGGIGILLLHRRTLATTSDG